MLVGSQVVGIALARYVVLVEPLASMAADEVIDLLAPTFQRFLVGAADGLARLSNASRTPNAISTTPVMRSSATRTERRRISADACPTAIP